MKRTVRIVSNGQPGGTRIFDPETGEDVRYVTKVTWSSGDVYEDPQARLELILTEAEVEGRAQAWIGARQVKSITFADGQTDEFDIEDNA